MSTSQSEASGPDLTQGVALDAVDEGGMLAGHVGEDAVLLVRRGDAFYAIGATCTHYNGPLAEGLIVGDTVRCPWHPSFRLTHRRMILLRRQRMRSASPGHWAMSSSI